VEGGPFTGRGKLTAWQKGGALAPFSGGEGGIEGGLLSPFPEEGFFFGSGKFLPQRGGNVGGGSFLFFREGEKSSGGSVGRNCWFLLGRGRGAKKLSSRGGEGEFFLIVGREFRTPFCGKKGAENS